MAQYINSTVRIFIQRTHRGTASKLQYIYVQILLSYEIIKRCKYNEKYGVQLLVLSRLLFYCLTLL